MPQFTLRQLEVFVTVARTLNVTKAGEALHLSASATSAAITELERAVGASLCVRRKGRGVQITSEGRAFEQMAAHLLSEAIEMENRLAEYNSDIVHGTLRIGSYSPLAASILPQLMRGFSAIHPSVRIEIIEATDEDLHRKMLDGVVDVALGYERPAHAELEYFHLASRFPYVLIAGDHPLASRESISLPELVDEPLIVLDIGESSNHLMAWFNAADALPTIRLVTHDMELTRSMVGLGFGYAVLIQRHRHNLTLDGLEVRSIEISPHAEPNKVYMTVARSAKKTARVKAFVDYAREAVPNFPEWTGFVANAPAPSKSYKHT